MEANAPLYVDSPTIPAGMTVGEYRRLRAASRPRPARRRLAARLRRLRLR